MAKSTEPDKALLRNLIGGILFVFAAVVVISILMALFTRHNRELTVPDFASLEIAAAEKMADHMHLRIEVVDSVYVKHLPLGVVFAQNPPAGARVKKNRRIFLTMNSQVPRQVPMPSVIGYSLRQAAAELAACNLRIGTLSYVTDIATNNVLRQKYKGRDIARGKQIEVESSIDLVLGLSGDDATTKVPRVKGFTYKVAANNIHESSLNVGKVVYDESVKSYSDTLRAQVYKQSPGADGVSEVAMGRKVDIYLTLDEEKLK